MSKLFDQLKKAARTREEKSPGLLLEALQRSQHPDAIVAPAEPVTPGATPAELVTPGAAPPQRLGARFPYSGVILAAAILAVVVIAWNANPWRAPARVKIDPSGLKLERSLDLKRPSSEGTSPPARPS